MNPADESRPPVDAVSDKLYRLICEHSSAALIATDTDFNIQVWNSAAGRIFGAAAKQMVGTPVLSVLPAQRRSLAERLLVRAVSGREVNEFEFEQKDESGGVEHFSVWVAPVVNEENVAVGVSIWVRDITRRRQLFNELAQGRKMVALGEMAGAVAHHFNNILGGLVTGVDFALASDDPGLQQRTLIQTGKSLSRATHLVDNLLAFAEGDHRADDLADLTEVLLGAFDRLEPELADAKVNLTLDLKPVPVRAVPRQRFTTAIFNFVHNAVEAMPNGGDLKVSLVERNGQCVLQFRDTGCGMAQEDMERMFEPFYSTKSLSTGPGGEHATGLGLSVAHGVIQELSGKVSVTSQLGSGTTVEVSIPPQQGLELQ